MLWGCDCSLRSIWYTYVVEDVIAVWILRFVASWPSVVGICELYTNNIGKMDVVAATGSCCDGIEFSVVIIGNNIGLPGGGGGGAAAEQQPSIIRSRDV